ncbi:hypothetical protein D3C75_1297990 [compost metagenome]
MAFMEYKLYILGNLFYTLLVKCAVCTVIEVRFGDQSIADHPRYMLRAESFKRNTAQLERSSIG